MTRSAEHLVTRLWAQYESRDVYPDFNTVTLQIVTDALFGFQPSTPESQTVTGHFCTTFKEICLFCVSYPALA